MDRCFQAGVCVLHSGSGSYLSFIVLFWVFKHENLTAYRFNPHVSTYCILSHIYPHYIDICKKAHICVVCIHYIFLCKIVGNSQLIF